MTRITAVQPVLPPYRYPQDELTAVVSDLIGAHGARRAVVERVHGNCGVQARHVALPLERYAELTDFGQANDAFVAAAADLGAEAVEGALAAAGLTPADVDVVVSTTVTGLAVPSLDALVATRLGMREDVRRVPVLGLGCAGGAGGLGVLGELLAGRPDGVGVLVSVELCSLTIQREDTSTANVVASGLFGDGASAVVAVGDAHPAPGVRIVDSASRLYPGTAGVIGWDVGASGLRIVLGPEVPGLVRAHLGADVDAFLARHDLTRADIGWWVCHPGGPKVIEAMTQALGVDDTALALTWAHLARVGNLSSSSVLHVLADTLADAPPPPGSPGLVIAMGPGFGLEMVLLSA
ncbi:type III polyketide synthase [Georgenia faecalis]|uniref:Type III polyketide synthase n=1 Tax=Georgenia faecalis TaxID=2483799 RepID=A0ABV9DBF5_9MICO|nr:3-oxoacyl-[acyl-carrier-protein] synthase III C-terminal domain-containing protein [Georgenia faecalis]